MALFTRSQLVPDVFGFRDLGKDDRSSCLHLGNAAREQFLLNNLSGRLSQDPATGLRHVGMPKRARA